jgi:hypothetical protein
MEKGTWPSRPLFAMRVLIQYPRGNANNRTAQGAAVQPMILAPMHCYLSLSPASDTAA